MDQSNPGKQNNERFVSAQERIEAKPTQSAELISIDPDKWNPETLSSSAREAGKIVVEEEMRAMDGFGKNSLT